MKVLDTDIFEEAYRLARAEGGRIQWPSTTLGLPIQVDGSTWSWTCGDQRGTPPRRPGSSVVVSYVGISLRANALKEKTYTAYATPSIRCKIPCKAVIGALIRRGGLVDANGRFTEMLTHYEVARHHCEMNGNNYCDVRNGVLLKTLRHDSTTIAVDGGDVNGMSVSLLPYQRYTLNWMLEKEKQPLSEGMWSQFRLPEVKYSQFQNKFWPFDTEASDQTGELTTVNSFCYSPALNRFQINNMSPHRGGLLATEMGLGKTVITLALVLSLPASRTLRWRGNSRSVPRVPHRPVDPGNTD